MIEQYFGQLQQINDNVAGAFGDLSASLSEIDRNVSQIYHEIENDVFNVVEGYRHAKRLQDVLHRRRVIKNEMRKLYPILDLFNGKNSFVKAERRFEGARDSEKYERSLRKYSKKTVTTETEETETVSIG